MSACVRYETDLIPGVTPLVGDLCTQGDPVFPTAGLLEIGVAAVSCEHPLVLENVALRGPAACVPGARLRTVRWGSLEDGCHLELVCVAPSSGEPHLVDGRERESLLMTAVARPASLAAGRRAEHAHANHDIYTSHELMSADAIYARLGQVGVRVEGALRRLNHVHMTESSATAGFGRVPPAERDGYVLDPTALESALHVALLFWRQLGMAEAEQPLAVTHIGALAVFAPGGEPTWCRVAPDGSSALGIELHGRAGLLAQLEGVCFAEGWPGAEGRTRSLARSEATEPFSPASPLPAAMPPRTEMDLEATIRGRIEAVVSRFPELAPVRRDARLAGGVPSVVVLRLINELERALGVRPDLESLYEHGSLEWLCGPFLEEVRRHWSARDVESHQDAIRATSVASPEDETSGWPLMPGQKQVWLADQASEHGCSFNEVVAWELRGAMQSEALSLAVSDLARMHGALRSVFVERQGETRQLLVDGFAPDLEMLDVSGEVCPWTAAVASARSLARARFALDRVPPWRVRIYALGPQRWLLVLVIHHLLGDGWSLATVLPAELARAYGERLRGQAPVPRPSALHAGRHALLERARRASERHAQQSRWWVQSLQGVEVLDLACLARRDASSDGEALGVMRVSLSAPDARMWRRLLMKEQTTLFVGMVALLQVVLWRRTGTARFVIGVPMTNRLSVEAESILGCLMNQLPLPSCLREDEPFGALLERVHAQLAGALDRQDVDVLDLLRDDSLMPDAVRPRVGLVIETAGAGRWQVEGLDAVPVDMPNPAPKLPLLFRVLDGDDLVLAVEYDRRCIDPDGLARMLEGMRRLMRTIDADALTSRLDVLGDDERDRVLADFNRTQRPLAEAHDVVQVFLARASTAPEAVAVVDAREHLSYRALDLASRRLAARLASELGTSGGVVAVVLPRSMEFVVAWLGVLRAGFTVLALDPEAPTKRRTHMLDRSDAVAIVTSGRYEVARHAALEHGLPIIETSDGGQAASGATTLPRSLRDRPAYAAFTSGSTGVPKGSLIGHDALLNLALAQSRRLGLDAGDRVAQIAAITFDASVSEIVMALVSGATLHVLESTAAACGPELCDWLRARGISCATLTPSALSTLPASELPELRTLVAAGEPLARDLANRWAPGRRLWNAYGPSECAVCATMSVVRPDETVITVGSPIDNMRVYVLDAHGDPAGIGVPGEVYIAGVGVGAGYLKDSEESSARFSHDPWHPEQRMYRTGDRGAWLPDGRLQLLGRCDGELKVRGVRIDPGEVESIARAHGGVRQAAALPEQDGSAYTLCVVAEDSDAMRHGLWRALHEALPRTMWPSALVVLSAIPANAHGKVDWEALREACGAANARRHPGADARRPPIDEQEDALLQACRDILRAPWLGPDDDWFTSGAHSLNLLQIAAHAKRALDVQVSLRDLLETGSVAKLRERLAVGGEDGPRIAAAWRSSAPPGEGVWQPLTTAPSTMDPLVLALPGIDGDARVLRELGGCIEAAGLAGLVASLDGDTGETASSVARTVNDLLGRLPLAAGGPELVIVGWSYGAVVAYELGQRLHARGRPVHVVLLDPPWPGASRSTEQLLHDAAAAHGLARRGKLPPAGIGRMHLAVCADRLSALEGYVLRKADFPVLCIFARQGGVHDVAPGAAEWLGALGGRARTASIPANHFEILEPPFVEDVWHEIAEWLSRAGALPRSAMPQRAWGHADETGNPGR